MKKILAVAFAATLALALAGCSSSSASSSASASAASGSESASAASASASAESASASAASESASAASAGMANPWTTVATAEEAAQGAGLESFNVADLSIGDLKLFDPEFSYMEGVAQAKYQGGAFEVTFRKSATVSGQELSGDYNEYPNKWTTSIGDVQVECQGYKGDMAASFTWSKDGANYSVMFTGLGGENMAIGGPDLETIIENLV